MNFHCKQKKMRGSAKGAHSWEGREEKSLSISGTSRFFSKIKEVRIPIHEISCNLSTDFRSSCQDRWDNPSPGSQLFLHWIDITLKGSSRDSRVPFALSRRLLIHPIPKNITKWHAASATCHINWKLLLFYRGGENITNKINPAWLFWKGQRQQRWQRCNC